MAWFADLRSALKTPSEINNDNFAAFAKAITQASEKQSSLQKRVDEISDDQVKLFGKMTILVTHINNHAEAIQQTQTSLESHQISVKVTSFAELKKSIDELKQTLSQEMAIMRAEIDALKSQHGNAISDLLQEFEKMQDKKVSS